MKISFDKAQLPNEVKSVLQSKSSIYAQSTALAQHVGAVRQPTVHTLLCAANLEMACAEMTELEEDIVDFGNAAIEWLNKALAIEPENDAIRKYIPAIRKKIKKAEKSANEILAYEKENLDDMPGLSYVKELAFYYYSRCRKSREFADKGYAAYKYIYDKEKADSPDSPELLYYWHALAMCKFTAYGYNASKTEIEQLIDWKLTPESWCYRESITDAYWIRLFHCSEVNDLEAFRTLYAEWYSKMVPLEKAGKPYLAMPDLLNPISRWLLLQEGTEECLAYILENGYRFFDKRVLDEGHFEVMELIEKRLN